MNQFFDEERMRGLAVSPEVRNQCNVFASENGILVTEMQDGTATVEMTVTSHAMNPWGSVHGGALYTMADVAAGAATNTVMQAPTTVNSSFSYLRPGLNAAKLTAKGEVIKCGRRVAVARADVYDQDGQLLCTGTFTYMLIQ